MLVKEYIDDGITGTLLGRPTLEELRQDAKADLYDRVYFHAADRIAREATHQQIIISELVRRGKKITVRALTCPQTLVPAITGHHEMPL